MRICFVTRELEGVTAYTGGLGVRYAAMARELARQGHELHVVTGPAASGRAVDGDGYDVHAVDARERRWPPRVPGLGRAAAVATAVRRLGRFDVVYAPEWGGDAAGYALRKASGPLLTNLTTSLEQVLAIAPWPMGRSERARARLQRHLERRQTERSDGVVGCSRAVTDWAARLWNLRRVPSIVIPNTVDVDRARALSRGGDALAGDGDGPTIAFSGRLEARKGVHVLVEAMRSVWETRPGARVVLVGRDSGYSAGTMSAHLRELAGPHAERLRICGAQPPERLFPTLAAADIVVAPSLWEAFGLVALEAMALGAPVVATTGSGFDDYMTSEEDSLLVPPGDSAALAAAISRLLDDAALRGRIGTAAAVTAERFHPATVVRRLAEHFETVAHR